MFMCQVPAEHIEKGLVTVTKTANDLQSKVTFMLLM